MRARRDECEERGLVSKLLEGGLSLSNYVISDVNGMYVVNIMCGRI